MIELPRIPVDLDPVRLAERAGVPAAVVEGVLAVIRSDLRPAALFLETRPEEILTAEQSAAFTEKITAGLAVLGPGTWDAAPSGVDRESFSAVVRVLWAEVLGFVEYRIRQYLKPAGRSPGERIIPGCPGLPLAVNRNILELVDPERRLGVEVGPDGVIDGSGGLAFIYPTQGLQPAPGLCAACSRADCPSRKLL
ncbi:MAG: hypothetical protein V1816_15215 [Pseudomonadota bacterium]